MDNSQSLASGTLSRPKIIRLAIPIMLANSVGAVVGIVDTAVIGRLGDTIALAAIALGAVIYGALYWGFGFLRMSTAGLSAQADGAGDGRAVQAHLARAVPLGFAIGTLILALQFILLPLIFMLYPASAEVEASARSYLFYRLWGLPATLSGIALMGWFIGLGRPKGALIMQIALNGVNGALSIYLVLYAGMGVAGVAIASAIAEWIGLMMGLILALREIKARGGLNSAALSLNNLLDKTALSALASANSNLFIRTLALMIGFQFFTWQSASLGAVFLAANYILLQFFHIIALLLDSFANVAEAATGAAYGARKRDKFNQAVRLTTELSASCAFLAALIIFLAGPIAIDLMTIQPDVRIAARQFLPYCAVIPIAGFAAWQLDGIFIGTTHTRAMRNAGIIAVIIYLIAHFAITPFFGPQGLWIAFIIYFIVRAVTLAPYYKDILEKF